ncbi:peptidoglycan-binding domain-containing protein [Streptomyces ipomoeae]|uniref:peptidoglycan-binding domain-containing protein n=1 Tax=Streptomyces ipomoeae TaxID=103232 RepID=UPI001146FA1B|nr:peptidoglycan-binding domain-containing protein [Streptomyces ipomoeae]MDX2933893.1 peptidoglycan-binding domain-containing protein [Streptomyces ipomoeae]TQE28846.1 peptidoglycan-binding protein [Streptomyces ipomoeae]
MSIPPEPGPTTKRRTIEPTYVMRRRRTEALAELLREMELYKGTTTPNEEYETVAVPPVTEATPGPRTPPPAPPRKRILPQSSEYETEELPPVMVGEDFGADTVVSDGRRPRRRPAPSGGGAGLKRAAVVVGVGAAALLGFGAALLLPGGDKDTEASPAKPTATPSAPATSAPAPDDAGGADPDGAGTLREGDSGPEVSELQQRLRRIPNVYDNGSTSGRYDVVLREAVARFQLWYGIRGDETGVYGNDTRKDLESRTTL